MIIKEIKRLKRNKDKKYEISQNDKTFIGFQMKCYFEETNNLKKREYDKDIIKNNLKHTNVILN